MAVDEDSATRCDFESLAPVDVRSLADVGDEVFEPHSVFGRIVAEELVDRARQFAVLVVGASTGAGQVVAGVDSDAIGAGEDSQFSVIEGVLAPYMVVRPVPGGGGRVVAGVGEGGIEGSEEFLADYLVADSVDGYPLGAVRDLFARSLHHFACPSEMAAAVRSGAKVCVMYV